MGKPPHGHHQEKTPETQNDAERSNPIPKPKIVVKLAYFYLVWGPYNYHVRPGNSE